MFFLSDGSIFDSIMNVSLISGVPVDPVLALDSVEQFNTIIWAHGGKISAIVCFCHILPFLLTYIVLWVSRCLAKSTFIKQQRFYNGVLA